MRRILIATFALLFLSTAPLAAQQNAPPAGYKDPGTATLMSVAIAGGGQMYAGEITRGLMIMGVAYGAPIAGYMVGSAACAGGACGLGLISLLGGSALGFGAWIYGVLDADDSARRMNAKNGFKVGAVRVQPRLGVARSGGAALGFQIQLAR